MYGSNELDLPIKCKKKKTYSMLVFASAIFLYAFSLCLIILNVLQRNVELEIFAGYTCFMATALIIYHIYCEPDLIVYETGIEIKFIFRSYHIGWDDILAVEKDYSKTYIIVKHLTLINRIFGLISFKLRPVFLISHKFEQHDNVYNLVYFIINDD